VVKKDTIAEEGLERKVADERRKSDAPATVATFIPNE